MWVTVGRATSSGPGASPCGILLGSLPVHAGRATIVEQYRTVSLRLAVCGAHRRDGEAHCAAHGSLPVRSGA